jgi:hypothetical protein
MRKMTFWLLALAGGILTLGNLTGALPENTNAPNELNCGRAPCHNVPVNVGDSQVSIEFANSDTVFFADSTYLLRVRIEDPMSTRNGFQILALDGSNQNAGTWSLTEPAKTKIISGIGLPNRKYVTHQAPGNQQSEWMMNWKAPAGQIGKVVFYASVLSANDNGQNTGDEVYSTKVEIAQQMPSAAGEAKNGLIKIYPLPAKMGVWVEILSEISNNLLVFSQYDASGILCKRETAEFRERYFFKTEGLAAGVYYLKIATPGGFLTERILIL